MAVPEGGRLGALLGVRARVSAAPFHLVLKGSIEVTDAEGHKRRVDAGEAIISLRREPHTLGCGRAPTTFALGELLHPESPRPGSGGPATSTLVCGAFFLEDGHLNPLLASLPAWLRVRPTPASCDALVAELEKRKPGWEYCVSRHLELMLAEAVRDAYERTHSPEQGPLRGLRDDAVGSALSEIHLRPSDAWSVEALARLAGLSPSRFAARFRELVGLGPIAYLACLRLDIAGGLLCKTEDRVSDVAAAVGYESVVSFSRAFKRRRGMSPSQWRSGTPVDDQTARLIS